MIRSGANLVELDLLRGSQRLPANEVLPEADYFAIVCRATERPRASAYSWSLRNPMPSFPIPLANGDPDVMLDLQVAFNAVYDRAGYDYTLNYDAEIEPPMNADDAEWAKGILESRHLGDV